MWPPSGSACPFPKPPAITDACACAFTGRDTPLKLQVNKNALCCQHACCSLAVHGPGRVEDTLHVAAAMKVFESSAWRSPPEQLLPAVRVVVARVGVEGPHCDPARAELRVRVQHEAADVRAAEAASGQDRGAPRQQAACRRRAFCAQVAAQYADSTILQTACCISMSWAIWHPNTAVDKNGNNSAVLRYARLPGAVEAPDAGKAVGEDGGDAPPHVLPLAVGVARPVRRVGPAAQESAPARARSGMFTNLLHACPDFSACMTVFHAISSRGAVAGWAMSLQDQRCEGLSQHACMQPASLHSLQACLQPISSHNLQAMHAGSSQQPAAWPASNACRRAGPDRRKPARTA